MSSSKKVLAGGGAKAAAQLRSTTRPSKARGNNLLSSPASSGDSSSDEGAAIRGQRRTTGNNRRQSSDESGDDDDASDDDDDEAIALRHPEPSSDSDNDPLEPSPPPRGQGNPAAATAKPSPPLKGMAALSIASAPNGGPLEARDAKGKLIPALPEEEALQIILDANGITREEHAKNPHTRAHYLEVFQINKYRRIQGFAPFNTAVRHLEIMHQNLTIIEGLASLVNLEILYLNNNNIRRICNLQNNVNLKELYLGENQITRLEGINHLSQLHTLSLYDNQLPGIEGIESLTKLKKLNLARNRIAVIGNTLDHLVELSELNLSDNLIGSFTEIRHISRLKQLEILYLNDPHHGDNPVCSLCNYHTYALYHLQHLQVLDTIRLSEEATALAEATFLKKQMYYNMRIKVCKGNTSNLIKKATEICKLRVSNLSILRRDLLRTLKTIEAELGEQEHGGGIDSSERTPISSSILENRKEMLESMLVALNRQVHNLSSFLPIFSRRLSLLSEQLIQRMILELETGGNIRFEDGVVGQEQWVLSCHHFMHTHLAPAAMSKKLSLGGYPSLRIRRVTKIHHRALRNAFEEGLENRQEVNGDGSPVKNSKPELHYAFYSGWSQPGGMGLAASAATSFAQHMAGVPGEGQEASSAPLLHVAQQGFPKSKEEADHTMANPRASPTERTMPGLILTNSVLYADLPRLVALQKAAPSAFPTSSLSTSSSFSGSSSFNNSKREPFISGGEILIAKVFLGASNTRNGGTTVAMDAKELFPGLPGTAFANLDSLVEEFQHELLGNDSATSKDGKSAKAAGMKGVHQDPEGSSDSERENSSNTSSTNSNSSSSGGSDSTKLKRIYMFDRDMVLPEYIVSFDYVRGDSPNDANNAIHTVSEIDPELLRMSGNFIGLREPLLDLTTMLSRLDRQENEIKLSFHAMLNAAPRLATRGDLVNVLEKAAVSPPPRFNSLSYLNLNDLGLKSLPGGSAVFDVLSHSLKVLLLNFNQFSKIEGHGFEKLSSLERLEINFNLLRKLNPGVFSGMHSLRHLELSYNLLSSSKDIAVVLQEVPKLLVLDLRGNVGLNKGKSYLPQVSKTLSNLTQLDLIPISGTGSGRNPTNSDIEDANLHPYMQYQGNFMLMDPSATSALTATSSSSSSSSAADAIKKSKAGSILSPYQNASSSQSSSSGKSSSFASNSSASDSAGSVSTVTDHLLLQQCFIDRDASMKQRGPVSSNANVNTNGTAAGARRSNLNVYTRVRLSDFLLGEGGLKELPTTIPQTYHDQVLEIELDHHRLSCMPPSSLLGRFSNLRKLSLYDNQISQIEGLEKNLRLEELSLEENNLTRIEGLNHLKQLSKLDLGKNRIAAIEVSVALAGLEPTLTQLSLEENRLKSLAGFETLTFLMELYLANNQIDSLKEIAYLKDLPRLLILDLSGNPIASMVDYRLYVIFNVKKLKVLDGQAIENAELQSARELYSGKLTEEMLTDILGHSYFKHIENLDLSNAKIRNMEIINTERFCNLRVLVLDNNHISDLSTLSPLPLLRVLRLNRNRISTIPFHEATSRGYLARCFPHLEVLELGYNRITSIAALNLKGLNELKVLTLESNEITRVDGLNFLSNLQQLVLAKNKIKRFESGLNNSTSGQNIPASLQPGVKYSSFYGLNELRGLQLEENGLRTLSGIGCLPKLKSLFLAYNRLTDMVELDHLSSDRFSTVLQEVTLRNNPLARKHLYRATLLRRVGDSLQLIDGKEITQEEREKCEAMMQGGIGSNGEPLIAASGGMPNGAVYFYSNQPSQEKVPIKVQSFSLTGFDNPQAGNPNAVMYGQSPSPTHFGGGGGGLGGLGLNSSGGLGIGGVGLGVGGHGASSVGAGGPSNALAAMHMNMSTNMMASAANRSMYPSPTPGSGPTGLQGSALAQQLQSMAAFGAGSKISVSSASKNKASSSIKGRKM